MKNKKEMSILSEGLKSFIEETKSDLLERGQKEFSPEIVFNLMFSRLEKRKEKLKSEILEKHSPIEYKLKMATKDPQKLKVLAKILETSESKILENMN